MVEAQCVAAPCKDKDQTLSMIFLDGTTIRAHHKAAGAAKKRESSGRRRDREALGRSRGGFGTKVEGSKNPWL